MNDRYYIDTHGNDDSAYQNALKFAVTLSKQKNTISKIIFLVGNKTSTGWLDRLYGESTVKELFKGIRQGNLLVKIETVRTYSNSYSDGTDVVIGCGLNSKELFSVEDYRNVANIIAIPWLKSSMQSWIDTKNPSQIAEIDGQLTLLDQEDAANNKPSLIVQEALDELSSIINKSTGITHSMDNSRAKTYMRALHKYEPELNADIISSYLVNEQGWQVRHANDVRKLIDTLNAGRYFTGGDKTGLQNHYKRWKDRLSKK